MFEGLMPVLITPFDEEGELDLRATEAVVERHIEAGVNGISALGSTGEFSHLDHRGRGHDLVLARSTASPTTPRASERTASSLFRLTTGR